VHGEALDNGRRVALRTGGGVSIVVPNARRCRLVLVHSSGQTTTETRLVRYPPGCSPELWTSMVDWEHLERGSSSSNRLRQISARLL